LRLSGGGVAPIGGAACRGRLRGDHDFFHFRNCDGWFARHDVASDGSQTSGENVCTRERNCGIVPCLTFTHGEEVMAGILLWLMGVPLIVIILLYLIF
jgi:hypothetical protein